MKIKSTNTRHSYDAFGGVKDSAEHKRLQSIADITHKSSAEKYAKTPQEKVALKIAMQAHPTKRGAPDNKTATGKIPDSVGFGGTRTGGGVIRKLTKKEIKQQQQAAGI